MRIEFGSPEANRIAAADRKREAAYFTPPEFDDEDDYSLPVISITTKSDGSVSFRAEGDGFLPVELVNAILGKS